MATPTGYAQMLQNNMPGQNVTTYSPVIQQSGYQQAMERASRRRRGRAGRFTGGQLLRGGSVIQQGSALGSVSDASTTRDILMADAPTAKSLFDFASGIKGRIRKRTKTYADHLGLTKDMDVDSVDFYKIKQSGGTRAARGQRSADNRRQALARQLESRYRSYLKDFQKQLDERAKRISQLT